MSHVRWTVLSDRHNGSPLLHKREVGLKCEDGKMSVVDALMLISVPQILLFTAVFIITERQEISMNTCQHEEEERKACYETVDVHYWPSHTEDGLNV